jgi:hypothetical protein
MDKRAMELMLARVAKDFLPYRIDQRLLLPPDLRDWLPEGHWFVDDLVEPLDWNVIYAVYQSADDRGRRGYHPAMMVKLLVYGYCVGKPSRKIERKRHLKALGALFAQVLVFCHQKRARSASLSSSRPCQRAR